MPKQYCIGPIYYLFSQYKPKAELRKKCPFELIPWAEATAAPAPEEHLAMKLFGDLDKDWKEDSGRRKTERPTTHTHKY